MIKRLLHTRYRVTDLERIARTAQSVSADVVVTTEKDEVRFEAVRPLPFTCVAVPMTLHVDAWATLCESVAAAIARGRARGHAGAGL